MNNFGSRAFSGSRFIFWGLAPFLVLFGIGMPFLLWKANDITHNGALIGLGAVALLLTLGLWNPRRFRWALRLVSGSVFCVYLAYLVYEIFYSDAPPSIGGRRSQPSPWNAGIGFLVIGIPSLMYALLGRFSLREEEPTEGAVVDEAGEILEERSTWRGDG